MYQWVNEALKHQKYPFAHVITQPWNGLTPTTDGRNDLLLLDMMITTKQIPHSVSCCALSFLHFYILSSMIIISQVVEGFVCEDQDFVGDL